MWVSSFLQVNLYRETYIFVFMISHRPFGTFFHGMACKEENPEIMDLI